jgi:transcriptional regulator with XRE-family HTH domain
MVQQELADKLGKPQSFVAKVERGERRIEFIAIARAIGRDPLRLMKQYLEEASVNPRRSGPLRSAEAMVAADVCEGGTRLLPTHLRQSLRPSGFSLRQNVSL